MKTIHHEFKCTVCGGALIINHGGRDDPWWFCDDRKKKHYIISLIGNNPTFVSAEIYYLDNLTITVNHDFKETRVWSDQKIIKVIPRSLSWPEIQRYERAWILE